MDLFPGYIATDLSSLARMFTGHFQKKFEKVFFGNCDNITDLAVGFSDET